MIFMSLDVNCTEGARRAEILTSPASDTALVVDNGDFRRLGIIGIRRHHSDGPDRASTCAIATLHTVGQRYAVVLDPHGVTNLDRRFIGTRDFSYRACGTDLRTACALRAAVAALVGRFGLHQCQDTRRGAKYTCRADRHTELTAGAVLREMAQALCAGRHDRSLSCRYFFVGNDREAAVNGLVLGLGSGSKSHSPYPGHKSATCSVNLR